MLTSCLTAPAACARCSSTSTRAVSSSLIGAPSCAVAHPGASKFIVYVLFFDGKRDQVVHEGEQRRASVGGSAQFLRALDEVFETGNNDRLEKRLLGGEMTVDSADTNPRSAGHFVDRHPQALRREDLLRRLRGSWRGCGRHLPAGRVP